MFFYVLIFSLPFYNVRVPLAAYGRMLEFSVVEVLVWIFVLSVLIYERAYLSDFAKQFLQNTQTSLTGPPRPTLFPRSLAWSLCALFLGLFLGALQSNNPLLTLGIIRGWFMAPIALFLALCTWRNFPLQQKGALAALAMSGAAAAAGSIFWPNGFNGDGRLQGFYGSPNYLAMYIAPLLPLAAYQWRQPPQGLWRYIWLACATVMAWAIFLSYSQGAWIGLVAGAMFLACTHRSRVVQAVVSIKKFVPALQRPIPYTLYPIPLLVLLWILWQVLGEVLIVEIQSRTGLWQAAVNMGADNPLFGIGAGMFPEAYQLQKHIITNPVPTEVALHPHNIFLTFWLYGGALGLVGFLGILRWLFMRFRATTLYPIPHIPYHIVASAFIIILTHGLVDTTYWKNDLAFMWWILMAFAYASGLEQNKKAQ